MKYLKFILIVASATLVSQFCHAQNINVDSTYTAFTKSIGHSINYPVELFRDCRPTICLIKLQVDSTKKIISMELSDSADSLMKVEFNKKVKRFDFASFEKYIKSEYSSNTCQTYIIPFSYHLLGCLQKDLQIGNILQYFKFKGTVLTNNVTVLNPIIFLTGVQQ